MKTLSDAQLIDVIYRYHHGEKLTDIAKDYGIAQSTLSQIKSRRSADWQRIHNQIIMAEIVYIVFSQNLLPDSNPEK